MHALVFEENSIGTNPHTRRCKAYHCRPMRLRTAYQPDIGNHVPTHLQPDKVGQIPLWRLHFLREKLQQLFEQLQSLQMSSVHPTCMGGG